MSLEFIDMIKENRIINNQLTRTLFKTFLLVEIIFTFLYFLNGPYYGFLLPFEYHGRIWGIILKTSTIERAVFFSMPIVITAVGAAFNERAGVINIGLEGIMVFGAFAAAYFTYQYNNNPWMGVFGAILFGFLAALIHAIITITYRGEQIVTGVAINLLALGMTKVFTQLIWGTHYSPPGETIESFNLFEIPIIGDILHALSFTTYQDHPLLGNIFQNLPDVILALSNMNILVYIGILLIPLCHLLLFNTTIGLRIRVIGEHPQAAETAGIPVYRYQYLAVLISGVLAGFGGSIMSIAITTTFQPDMIGGRGFIALAAMIFGKWTIIGSAGASLFFAYFFALQFDLGQIPGFHVPKPFLQMIPYVITMVAIAGFIGDARPPKNIGQPYEAEDTDLKEIFIFWLAPFLSLIFTIFMWNDLTAANHATTPFVFFQYLSLLVLIGSLMHFGLRYIKNKTSIDDETHGATFEIGFFYFVLFSLLEVIVFTIVLENILMPLVTGIVPYPQTCISGSICHLQFSFILIFPLFIILFSIFGAAAVWLSKKLVADKFMIGMFRNIDLGGLIKNQAIKFFAMIGLIQVFVAYISYLIIIVINPPWLVNNLILLLILVGIYNLVKQISDVYFRN